MFARTLSAALFALAAVCALPASAQQNDSVTVQTGGGVNTSATDQRGHDNHATTAQFGFDNMAGIRQHGSVRNKAECGQDGKFNDCSVVQRNRNGK